MRDAGGADVPIKVVAVKEGGGTVAAIRAQMLGEAPLASGAIRLESAKHVIKVVAQEPGAIGVIQLGLLQHSGLKEAKTERFVEQPLSFVTRGPPSERLLRLIEITRKIVAGHHE